MLSVIWALFQALIWPIKVNDLFWEHHFKCLQILSAVSSVHGTELHAAAAGGASYETGRAHVLPFSDRFGVPVLES